MSALIGVLAVLLIGSIILPPLGGSSKSKLPQIFSNLRQIDAAKEAWAWNNSVTTGVIISQQDLAKYFDPRNGSTQLVGSVDGEVYRLNPIGTPSEARLERPLGTRFPAGTLVRWSTNGDREILLPSQLGGANGWQPLYSETNQTPAEAVTGRSP